MLGPAEGAAWMDAEAPLRVLQQDSAISESMFQRDLVFQASFTLLYPFQIVVEALLGLAGFQPRGGSEHSEPALGYG